MAQAISFLAIIDSCQQPVRQEMQRRMALTFPFFALRGQYGSARSWRERPTMSVFPSARIFSQYSGFLREWLMMTGIFTAFLIASDANTVHPSGYCMGSNPAPGLSCTHWLMSTAATPAVSKAFATSTDSGSSRPPGTHSSEE